MNRLELEVNMSKSAMDHILDTGDKGIINHVGSDGSRMTERMDRYGEWNGHLSENIDYGTIKS